MWKFRNGNVFVLFFWTIYAPLLEANFKLVFAEAVPQIPPGQQQPLLQQPCDRTRRVFTESHGEISDGPVGSNYTQVNIRLSHHYHRRTCLLWSRFCRRRWEFIYFLHIYRVHVIAWADD